MRGLGPWLAGGDGHSVRTGEGLTHHHHLQHGRKVPRPIVQAVDVLVRHVGLSATPVRCHGVLDGRVAPNAVVVGLQPDLPVRATTLADEHRPSRGRRTNPDGPLRVNLDGLKELGGGPRIPTDCFLGVILDVQPEHVGDGQSPTPTTHGEEGQTDSHEQHRTQRELAAPPPDEHGPHHQHAGRTQDDESRVGLQRGHVLLGLLVPRGHPRALIGISVVQGVGVAVAHAVHVERLAPPDETEVEDLLLVDRQVPGREREGDELRLLRAARGRPVGVEQLSFQGLIGVGSARVYLQGHERVEDHHHDQGRARQELETERLTQRFRAEPEADQEPHHQHGRPDHPEPLAVGPVRTGAPHELPAHNRQRHQQAAADHDAVGLGEEGGRLTARGLNPGFNAQAHAEEQHVRRPGNGPAGRAEHGGVELARQEAHRPEGQEQRERRHQHPPHQGLLDVEPRKEVTHWKPHSC